MNAPSSPGPSNYNIFFSHKVEDEPVARKIIDLLRRHTENVQHFISEDIKKRKNWQDELAQHLKLSSSSVLIFIDPEEDWGWCLYETGFFDALTQIPDVTHARRIYCLHNAATAPPSPMPNLQTITAEPEDVARWLRGLFEYTKQTKKEFANDFPQITRQICGLFADSKESIYCAKYINMIIKCSSLKTIDDLPGDCSGRQRIHGRVFRYKQRRNRLESAKERFREFPDSSEVPDPVIRMHSRS